MKKYFMLAAGNIKKTKSNSVSMFILFVIAAFLLNAGLLVLINFHGFFNKVTRELDPTNAVYVVSESIYSGEVDKYIRSNENVTYFQPEDAVWGNMDSVFAGEVRNRVTVLANAGNKREKSKWKFIGKHLEATDVSIYLPVIFQKSGGYELNDKFELTAGDKKFVFIVKGFFEDVYFSSFESGFIGFYLPEPAYNKIKEEFPEQSQAKLLYINLRELKFNKEVEIGLRETSFAVPIGSSPNLEDTIFCIDIELLTLSRTFMADGTALMMVMFAVVVGGVCLLVVRFRISNTIEEDMTKIGSLKAVGYTGRQVIFSFVLQFSLIAFAGALTGVALSYCSVPLLSDFFARQSGIAWEQGFDAALSTAAAGFILLAVCIVTFFTSKKINSYLPIDALREGVGKQSFKKNKFPLEKTRGRLSVILALKSLFQNLKQSVMIIVILTATAFAGTFSVIMFYNTTVDLTAFWETPGVELASVTASLNPEKDNGDIIDGINALPEVRKAQFIDCEIAKIGNNEIYIFVMDDFAAKETNTVYKGRYPRSVNEISISGSVAEKINKRIGDSVTVERRGVKSEYLITGLIQGAFMTGMHASLTTRGYLEINPGYTPSAYQIYLYKGRSAEDFISKLEGLYPEGILSLTNLDAEMILGAGVYADIVRDVGVVIGVISVFVVVLVLYFLVSSSLIKRRKELGIQRAIGFTAFQLMNQVSLGFVLPTFVGVGFGCLLGGTQTNALMSVAQKAMGINKANYIVKAPWIAAFGVMMLLVTYVSSLVLTGRIRKISSYDLTRE